MLYCMDQNARLENKRNTRALAAGHIDPFHPTRMLTPSYRQPILKKPVKKPASAAAPHQEVRNGELTFTW